MSTTTKDILSDAKNVICTYFRETTVHGFRYVVEGSDICDRVFWIVCIIVSFSASGKVIYTSFLNWNSVPVQTTIETVSLSIEELHFPATTVCNLEELEMPRRNRRLFLERLLNLMDIKKREEFPLEGKQMKSIF